MHYIYQYPMWMTAVVISAVCRMQIQWNKASMSSAWLDVMAFTISVILVLIELDHQSSPIQNQNVSRIVVLRKTYAGLKRSLKMLVTIVVCYIGVNEIAVHAEVPEMINDLRYLWIFQLMTFVMSVCSFFKQLLTYQKIHDN